MGEWDRRVDWQVVLANLKPDEIKRIPKHYLTPEDDNEVYNLKQYLMSSDYYRRNAPRIPEGGFRHRRSFRRTRRGSRRRSRRRR